MAENFVPLKGEAGLETNAHSSALSRGKNDQRESAPFRLGRCATIMGSGGVVRIEKSLLIQPTS